MKSLPVTIFLLAAGAAGAAVTPACHLLAPGPEGVDLSLVADDLELLRLDVQDAATLASPETRAKVLAVAAKVIAVEDALRAAAANSGPMHDVISAAEAALALADQLIPSSADGSDLKAVIVLARIALRHLSMAEFGQAKDAMEQPPK